jgi:hypothetical protein
LPGAARKSKKRFGAAGEKGRGLVSDKPPRPLLQSPEDPGTQYESRAELYSDRAYLITIGNIHRICCCRLFKSDIAPDFC